MKKLLIIICFCLLTVMSYAQVGIGTTNPQAQLDIRSSNQATPTNTDGILIPKVDVFPLTIPTANQDAMLVYLTTMDDTDAPGFYYWNQSTTDWISFSGVEAERINDLIDGKSDNDGSEDGSSVFLGIDAGLNDDSSDNRNVGVGYQSLNSNTTGYQNVANGSNALFSNTTGNYNIATGYRALYSNTTGTGNVANGLRVLSLNTTGSDNIGNGRRALNGNTTGNFNIAIGTLALASNTTGAGNKAMGYQALNFNTTGNYNIATGHYTLNRNITGEFNLASGYRALTLNTTGNNNVAHGYYALGNNTTADYNVASGRQALYSNTTGGSNVATGTYSLYSNIAGVNNVAYGYQSLYSNTLGSNSIAIGYRAGYNETDSNRLYIENSDADDALIYGEFDTDFIRINGTFDVTNEINREATGNANIVPIAYGTVESNGNVLSGTGNFTASITSGVITISVTGVTLSVNNTTCLVTPYSTAFRTSSIVISGGDLQVRIFNSSGSLAPTTFQFTIYKL